MVFGNFASDLPQAMDQGCKYLRGHLKWPTADRRAGDKFEEQTTGQARPPTLVAALFTTVKRWQQPKWPSDEWMKYYSPFKGKEMLTHAPAKVNLGDIVLRERSWSQKDKRCTCPNRH